MRSIASTMEHVVKNMRDTQAWKAIVGSNTTFDIERIRVTGDVRMRLEIPESWGSKWMV